MAADETAEAGLNKLLARTDFFALVSTFTPGREHELASLAEEKRYPLVAPYLMLPLDSQELLRYRFLLLAGLHEQVQVLAQAATRSPTLGDLRIAVVFPHRAGMDAIVDAAETIYREKGWRRLIRLPYAPGSFNASQVVKQLQAAGSEQVLFLGDEAEAEALMKAVVTLDPLPQLFLPAVLLGRGVYQLPPQLNGKIWLAFAALPDDRKDWGMKEFEGLVNRQQLPVTQLSAQLIAYAAAKLLVEGLRRSGRELSRERFVDALEGVFEYDTGLTPLISYGKSRRIGAFGAHIVTVDPAKAGTKEHISPKGWSGLK
jgi:ABC-type branched-subunit amino acid transport system substrate-binding protein